MNIAKTVSLTNSSISNSVGPPSPKIEVSTTSGGDPEIFKGGGGGGQWNFLQKGGPTTYSGHFVSEMQFVSYINKIFSKGGPEPLDPNIVRGGGGGGIIDPSAVLLHTERESGRKAIKVPARLSDMERYHMLRENALGVWPIRIKAVLHSVKHSHSYRKLMGFEQEEN